VTGRELVAELLVTAGVAAQLICVVGVCWLRDAFDALHFAAAGSTLGPVLIGAAVVVAGFSSPAATIQCVVALVLLVALNPVLTHVTARLAWQRRQETGEERPS
jgi:monovalent cation/proton antiporter MnhG/PhaG subunit